MKKKSSNRSAFFNLRVLIGLSIILAGISLALLGSGAFSASAASSAKAQQKPGFDCYKIHELGIDKQENLRAGAIMIACGLAEGGSTPHVSALYQLIQGLLAPLTYGGTDVDLITGGEISPNVTQSETFT